MRWIVLGAMLPIVVVSAACADEVVPATLIVRSGPGGNYRQIGVLTQGAQVSVIGQESRAYLPVRFSGGQGWVPTQFIRRSGVAGAPAQPGVLGASPFNAGTPVAGTPAPATPGPVTPAPVTPGVATPAPSFIPTPLGGPSNSGTPASMPATSPTPAASGGASSSMNSSPLTSALGTLATSGGGTNPLAALLGGGTSSNPLGALLGNSSGRGPSILNSTNTSPLPSSSGSATSGNSPAAAGGSFSNPGALGKSARVTASQLNVRTGPGTQYRVVGALFKGAQVTLTRNSGAWFETLQATGLRGWVHGAYLNQGGSSNLAPLSSIPGGTTTNGGLGSPLPGSAGGGAPAGAGNETKSSAGFIQLAASGTGYYSYYTSSRKWGVPRLIYGIQRTGRRLAQGGLPQLGVGDISQAQGGKISGHASHQRGVDVDCRLMYSDKVNRAGTITHPQYSSAWTTVAIRVFRQEVPTSNLFFNDRTVISAGLSTHWPNHANHFHLRAR